MMISGYGAFGVWVSFSQRAGIIYIYNDGSRPTKRRGVVGLMPRVISWLNGLLVVVIL